MEPVKKPCRRTRFHCSLCQQTLRYSASRRHQDLPRLYCPGYVSSMDSTQRNSESDSSDSSFVFDIPSTTSSPANDSIDRNDDQLKSSPVSPLDQALSSESESQSSYDSAPEVWDETDTSLTETDTESEESHQTAPVKQLHYIVCLFLAFFQLCFRVSDRALLHLLSFFSALFNHLCSCVKEVPYLIAFAKTFPTTLYSVRKCLKLKTFYITYVVCPRCHTLYKESQCLVKDSDGVTVSLKCSHIEYPNHPHQAHRKECGAELMKKVKVRRSNKYVPRKVYVYYSIIDSLQRLISSSRLLDQCEKWRGHRGNAVPTGYLTDVFDGRLWREWKKGWNSFLESARKSSVYAEHRLVSAI